MDDADHGLQPERTALAWLRTTIALLGAGALAIREGVSHGQMVLSLGGALAIAAGSVLIVVLGLRRRRPTSDAALPVILATGATVFGLVGLGYVAISAVWALV